jgi:hypothetical protein
MPNKERGGSSRYTMDAYDYAREGLLLTKSQWVVLAADAASDLGTLDCVLCGVDTALIGERYMVNSELWDEYGAYDGCLCIGCLERVMGRKLEPADFTDALTNSHPGKSERLRDPLGANTAMVGMQQ